MTETVVPTGRSAGTLLPIPCRSCGAATIPFTVAEGLHTVTCPKCGGITKVQATRSESGWNIRTEPECERALPDVSRQSLAIENEAAHGTLDELVLGARKKRMAKRRLSEEKKAALRADLKRELQSGAPKVNVLAKIAGKYGISPETVRWYIKNLRQQQGAKPGKAPKEARRGALKKADRSAPPAKSAAARKRSVSKTTARANGARNGATPRLADVVTSLTEKELERALKARRLLPSLEASRSLASTLRVKAREAERQAQNLEREYRRLTR